MRGLELNSIDFDKINLEIHNILKNRKDYNSKIYAEKNIETINNTFILVEPKKSWLSAIKSLGLNFQLIDNKIIKKPQMI